MSVRTVYKIKIIQNGDIMKGKELLILAVALVLALALTGCAPKDEIGRAHV